MKAYEQRDKYAQAVRDGSYGIVKAEWEDFDGWLDGYRATFFVLQRKVGHKVGLADLIIVRVNESGVFEKTSGWVRLRPDECTEGSVDDTH